MKETAYENENKVYVQVIAVFGEDGKVTPLRLLWEDGRAYSIDRVLDVRPAASLKAGGVGMRYICRVGGRRTFLFLQEDHRWFVERRRD